ETPVYKKSSVLYGLDFARANIGKAKQVVIVEGYTDVMACHLAGVTTAVASCGTAFGADHARMLERLLGGDDRGEVIFTFDGDAAGQKAALKSAELDSTFMEQTYVCIAPGGQDPCELRQSGGDSAVRDLIATREPLYRFVMRNTLESYDLDRADARVNALRAAAPLISSVRDDSKRQGFVRELSAKLGMPMDEVAAEVKRARGRKPEAPRLSTPIVADAPDAAQPSFEAFQQPNPRDRVLLIQRDVAKLLIQAPQHFAAGFNGLSERYFSHPGYQAVLRAVFAAGTDRGAGWGQALVAAADSEAAQTLITSLAVEPLLREPTESYVDEYVARLQLLRLDHDLAETKSKLQRTNPVENEQLYQQLFRDVVASEKERKELQRRAFGD
ncbi:MAG: toprim domain-containing protein, partial [Propionibacteriaceae bacterium]